MQAGTGPAQPLASSATYEPFGPLADLTLGNGLTETRTFDARYFPAGITVPGRLAWTYGTDNVGNMRTIADGLNAASSRTYDYRDFQYFLTRGDGPWGPRSWTYDKIGNRLTETRPRRLPLLRRRGQRARALGAERAARPALRRRGPARAAE